MKTNFGWFGAMVALVAVWIGLSWPGEAKERPTEAPEAPTEKTIKITGKIDDEKSGDVSFILTNSSAHAVLLDRAATQTPLLSISIPRPEAKSTSSFEFQTFPSVNSHASLLTKTKADRLIKIRANRSVKGQTGVAVNSQLHEAEKAAFEVTENAIKVGAHQDYPFTIGKAALLKTLPSEVSERIRGSALPVSITFNFENLLIGNEDAPGKNFRQATFYTNAVYWQEPLAR